jgi:hypothetical protein
MILLAPAGSQFQFETAHGHSIAPVIGVTPRSADWRFARLRRCVSGLQQMDCPVTLVDKPGILPTGGGDERRPPAITCPLLMLFAFQAWPQIAYLGFPDSANEHTSSSWSMAACTRPHYGTSPRLRAPLPVMASSLNL